MPLAILAIFLYSYRLVLLITAADMKKIILLSLGFLGGVAIFLGINAFAERAEADFTDPDAFTFTDPSSNTSESCPSCAEVSLNISLPKTSEPPKPPDGNTGGGSTGGGSTGGGGSIIIIKKETATTTVDQKKLPILTATTSKISENISEEKKADTSSFTSLFGLNRELAETISSDESKKITGRETRIQFSGNNLSLYKKVILSESAFSEKVKITVAYFIEIGTPTTKSLGSGERAGVINSYVSAFVRIPATDANWQDVIKIANGRWPAEKSLSAESKAAAKFKKIYLRTADMKKPNDNAAVTVMAYGLRPVKRNMNSEKSAILSFKYIYKKAPTTAEDWDIVRAIAYSGAKR
jgi:hypothetical protein